MTGGASGQCTVTLPNGVGVQEWTETVAAVGIVPANSIGLFLAATVDSDENEAEALSVTALSAAAGTDQITINMSFGYPTSGPIKLIWKVL